VTDRARRQWLRQLARETDRARLVRAREAVRAARTARRTARARARELCASARQAFKAWRTKRRAWLAAELTRIRERVRAETEQRRARVARCCGKEQRERVRAAGDAAIAAALEALEQLREEKRRERTWTRKDSAAPGLARVRERKAESDHEVEANLSPDELIVWKRVKREIKGTPRMSRLEAFQHWAHDHGAEVAQYIADDAEAYYARAVRDEQRERERAHKPRTDRQLARDVRAELDAVPF